MKYLIFQKYLNNIQMSEDIPFFNEITFRSTGTQRQYRYQLKDFFKSIFGEHWFKS